MNVRTNSGLQEALHYLGQSERARQFLRDLDDDLDPWLRVYGRSAHGGMVKVIHALRRRGLIDYDQQITVLGREAIHRFSPALDSKPERA